jgi:hypothetical protein
MTNNDKVLRQIVLGAGASSGYPLGSDLLRIIAGISKFFNPTIPAEFITKLKSIKFENHEKELITDAEDFLIKVKNFAENLKKSCATSIDFYTTRIADKKMQIVAKSLIGAVLKQYKTDLKNTWYGDLLPLFFPEDVVFKKPEEKLEMIIGLSKKIRIITFNYDLSLEKFLYEFLKNNVFVGGEEAQLESAKRVIFQTINHVYGSIDDPFNCDFDLIEEGGVGDLKKLDINYAVDNYPDKPEDFQFINLEKVEILINLIFGALKDAFANQQVYNKNIKLMENERRTEIENSDYKLIDCAYLYVLGFGFDPINIERIGMKPEVWGGKVYPYSEYGYGCYVTNFDDNKKIERLLINSLTKRSSSSYLVPIISKRKIADALKNDFSLIESAKNYETITVGINSKTSPFFALKKYQ